MENRCVKKRLRKEYSFTWKRSKWEKINNKNAPENFRGLSLSIEDAQGKMDTINSILNLSIMFF